MEEYIQRLCEYKKPDLGNIDEPTSAEYYYDPRAHLSTHEMLVNDQTTMSIFRGWIEDNHKFIKNKIVLDVGCGSGIFSVLAAKAGAAKVISIETSHIAVYAKKIIRDNHLDNVITVLKSNLEETVLPDGIEKVDTIISMWFGYSLFHGGCLKKVLYARDRWLKPHGVIIPDRASLYFAAIADDDFRETRINWWKNVYNLDFSCIIEDSLRYAQFDVVPAQKLVTNLCNIKNVNLRTDNYQDIIKEVPFELTALRNDFVQGFCTFFTVKFSSDVNQQRELNTHPAGEPTLWAQTSFYLRDYFMIKKREKIQGSFSVFGVNDDPRFLGIIIGTCFKGVMDEIFNMKTFVLRS